MGKGRLIIADDHDLVREGLRAVFEGEPDLHVVGEAQDGEQALSMCRSLRPDLVLMDVRMPKKDGLEATRAIKEEMPETSEARSNLLTYTVNLHRTCRGLT